ncbi:TolC family protein [Sulfuriferula thiophila]|uniref:TolC family protein n=1 Tax=Sulfuriferula thiophila TaxID=1781211 RepID=UPI000F6157E2|nr:TolC family protein [Sulfuriferula thiophila]
MFIRITLIAGIIAFAPLAVADQLRLDDAMNLAVANQPLLSGQRALIEANRQAIVADSQLPDPKLKLSVNNLPIDTYSLTQDGMTQRTISIEQSFPGGNKRTLRGQLAQTETEQSVADLAANMRDVRRATGSAWLDVYYPLQALHLVHEQQHAYQQQIAAARIDYRANKTSQDAVLALQNGLNQLQDREIELTAQAERARAMLARWVGSAAQRDLPNRLPDLPQPASLAQLRTQLTTHPEIRKLDQAIASADVDANLAKEASKPDWSLELGYSKRGPAYADMISAQVAVDLPIFPGKRQDKTSAAKQYLLSKARYQREDRLRSLEAELTAAYAEWQAANSRVALLQKNTLPNATQRISAALIGYGTASTSMNNVFEAHHAQLEANLQLLAQQVAQARALVQLGYFANEEKPQ